MKVAFNALCQAHVEAQLGMRNVINRRVQDGICVRGHLSTRAKVLAIHSHRYYLSRYLSQTCIPLYPYLEFGPSVQAMDDFLGKMGVAGKV